MKPSGWSAQAQWAAGKRLLSGVRWPCFLIGLALPLFTFAQSGRDAQQLTQVARQTGAVMAMRHTEVTGGNPVHFDASGQCRGETMLTHKGRAQAQQIRTLFEAQGIRPHVIHSPMCRTTETAKLAFPDSPHQTDPALREIASADAAQRQAFLRDATRLLREAPKDRLVVFIGHAPNLFALTMEDLGYGVGLLGRITADGDIEGDARMALYSLK